MAGAPSQLDLFDYKPRMDDWFELTNLMEAAEYAEKGAGSKAYPFVDLATL
jgi:hypothetical protein